MTTTATCTRKRAGKTTGCNCPPCTVLNRRTRKLRAAGLINRQADSDKAWALVDKRLAQGWDVSAFTRTLGYVDATASSFHDAMRAHLAGRPWLLNYATSERVIRALTCTDAPVSGKVSALGSQRRVQALAAVGWFYADIAEFTVVSVFTIRGVAMERYSTLSIQTHKDIVTAYEKLSNTQSPTRARTAQTITQSQRKGWLPPGAWDEDIDDPDAGPIRLKEGAQERSRARTAGFELSAEAGTAKRQAILERRAKIRELILSGFSHRNVAVQLRLTERMVERDVRAMKEEGML